MHLPGAEVGYCVHPECESCAHRLRYTLNNRENGAYTGCTALKIMHPALNSCTQGAGCTLNFEHCCSSIHYDFLRQPLSLGSEYLLVALL